MQCQATCQEGSQPKLMSQPEELGCTFGHRSSPTACSNQSAEVPWSLRQLPGGVVVGGLPPSPSWDKAMLGTSWALLPGGALPHARICSLWPLATGAPTSSVPHS